MTNPSAKRKVRPGRGWPLALLELQVLCIVGCGDVDVVCSAEEPTLWPEDASANAIHGSALVGSARLSAETREFTTTFEATLSGLPKVWTGNNTLSSPRLRVSLELGYADPALMGNELPTVMAVLDSGRPGPVFDDPNLASTSLPGIAVGQVSAVLSVAPFVVCSGWDTDPEGCCPFGATSCSGRAQLSLSREADLFPEVELSYTATPSAGVDDCVEPDSQATWSLAEVGQ